MMKKIIALILVLAMCAGVGAMAAEWAEGLGPQKPYTGSPEVDFNETFGYMMFAPVNGGTVAPGEQMLSIYLPREDVQAGEGELKLFTKENGLVEEIAISAETMVGRVLNDDELEGLMWGGGMVFEIALAKPLELNFNYYVQMSKGCMVSPDFEVASPAISGKKAWTFNTEVASYVESMTYCHMVEGQDELTSVETPLVGDSAKLSVVIGEDAAAAALYCDAGIIAPEATYFEETTETTVHFPVNGEVKWGIIFLNADGMGIYSVDYTTNVSDPMDIVEEALAE